MRRKHEERKMPALEDDREEALAHELAKGASQAAAYISAGFSAKNNNVAAVNCNRLLKKSPAISQRVGELKALARTEAFDGEFVADVSTLTRMLLEDRNFATEMRSASARTTATLGIAKLHGIGSETIRNPDMADTLAKFLETMGGQPRLSK